MEVNDVEYKVNFHTCGNEHPCPELCAHKGECEITYKNVEKTKETNL